jgi:hypothetical protein
LTKHGFRHRAKILGSLIMRISGWTTFSPKIFVSVLWSNSSTDFTVIDATKDLSLRKDSKKVEGGTDSRQHSAG